MKRKEEKRYTTGEFANYFGIKKDTLLYYDKIKLFHPTIVESNGYRYYTSSQINSLWTLLSLRNIGISIKILQDYFKLPSPDKLKNIAKSQIEKLDKEMANLIRIKQFLNNISSYTEEAMQATIGQVTITKLPDQWFIYSKKNNEETNTSNHHWENICRDFIYENNIKGYAYIGSIISQESLLKGQFNNIYKLFTKSHKKGGIVRKGGQYAILYYKGSYKNISNVYPLIIKEIEHLGFKIIGDAYEDYLISETTMEQEDNYITKISIKVSNLISLKNKPETIN